MGTLEITDLEVKDDIIKVLILPKLLYSFRCRPFEVGAKHLKKYCIYFLINMVGGKNVAGMF